MRHPDHPRGERDLPGAAERDDERALLRGRPPVAAGAGGDGGEGEEEVLRRVELGVVFEGRGREGGGHRPAYRGGFPTLGGGWRLYIRQNPLAQPVQAGTDHTVLAGADGA